MFGKWLVKRMMREWKRRRREGNVLNCHHNVKGYLDLARGTDSC